MTHPKVKHPLIDDVQRDFCFLLNAYDVEPGASTPKPNTMLDFNDVAVGQMRQLEFLADEEGDWAFHCHKSYHTMNPMGHTVPNMIGVEHRGLLDKIQRVAPEYMVMGERGMAGMFSTLKVRKNHKPGDYSDPGWFKQPPGTQSFEWTGALPAPTTHSNPASPVDLRVKKPGAGQHNH